MVDMAIAENNGCSIFDIRLKPTIDNEFPPWSRITGDFSFIRVLGCLFYNGFKNGFKLSPSCLAICDGRPLLKFEQIFIFVYV
jgi:hypothetical protein